MTENRRLLQECYGVLQNAGSIPFVTGTYKDHLLKRIAAELSLPEYVGCSGWVEVEGYEGVLKHCGTSDAIKIELPEGLFAIVGGKFYAYKVPSISPRSE